MRSDLIFQLYEEVGRDKESHRMLEIVAQSRQKQGKFLNVRDDAHEPAL